MQQIDGQSDREEIMNVSWEWSRVAADCRSLTAAPRTEASQLQPHRLSAHACSCPAHLCDSVSHVVGCAERCRPVTVVRLDSGGIESPAARRSLRVSLLPLPVCP